MSVSPDTLIDGDWRLPESVGAPRYEYPFRQNMDGVSALVEQDYLQRVTTFKPERFKRPAAPRDFESDLFPGFDFYLVGESRPVRWAAGLYAFTRVWARVPEQQTVPSSLFISKPEIPGTFPQLLGSSLILQPDATVASYDAYASRAVTGDSGAPSGYPTGGAYTLSFDGDTTASTAYNASNTTLQTNLNALTAISDRGNVTVTGSYNTAAGFSIVFGAYAEATANITGLTTTGTLVKRFVTANSGYSQSVGIEQSNPSPPVSGNATSLGTSFTGFGNPQGASITTQVNYAATGKTLVQIGPTYGGDLISGTFTLTINGVTTGAIPYGASSATIQTAVSTLGSYTVSGFTQGAATSGQSGAIGSLSFYVNGTVGTITAGTFTLTMFGQTTAGINWNASTASIASALNALTEVQERGNVTVSGTGLAADALSLSFTINFTNAAFTSASTLTPTGSIVTASLTNSMGQTQAIVLGTASNTRDIVVANHGIVVGDTIFITNGTDYYGDITNFGVPDVNTIRLIVTNADAWATLSTITSVGKLTLANYTPGIALTRVNRVTDFYLPGVTPGIDTADDIPLPVFQGDPASLTLAILNGAESINYQVGELEQWRDTPILARTITTLNAALL